jgi:hypothetical protein
MEQVRFGPFALFQDVRGMSALPPIVDKLAHRDKRRDVLIATCARFRIHARVR